MRVAMNDPKRTYVALSDEISAAVADTLESGWYLLGSATSRFETEFAEFVGASHCVAVANGTDALEIALRAVGVEGGDEVVTVSNAGGYTLTAAVAIGATPVFVDVESTTLTLDIGAVIEALTPSTKAVVATHLFGSAVDVPTLRRSLDRAARPDVAIVEDAAQAHGAAIGGVPVGSLGDIACFSFYPTKNLGALGDAGAVTTSDDDLAGRVRALHQYGWTNRYESTVRGGRNSRMDEIQAAVLDVALPHLRSWNERRRSIVQRYATALDGSSASMVHAHQPSERFVGHLAVARSNRRDELVAQLESRGVATALHYPVLDTEVPWLSEVPYVEHATPIARSARDEIVSLPCFPTLYDDEIEYVASVLADFAERESAHE